MPEIGFDCRRSNYGAGDTSPDSVFFTLGSNFSSLFSSTSGSGERCSFASNAEASQQHLAGHDLRHASSGPDSDLRMLNVDKNSRQWRKVGKADVQKDDSGTETDDSNLILNSGRNSFSQAMRECQDHRVRSDGLKLKEDRNLQMTRVSYSPRLGTNKRELITMSGQTSNLLSPRMTINHRHSSVDTLKGWSSERIPLHGNINRRNGVNGRALPSKWEDAERWIFSPASSDGSNRTSSHQQQPRKPKSKSGPLGPPGTSCYSLFSPAIPMLDGGKVRNLVGGSPFSTGIPSTGGFPTRSNRDVSGNFPARMEPFMARSISIHGCSDAPGGQFLLPGIQDKNLAKDNKQEGIDVYHAGLRKDVSTQMSPERNDHTSSNWELILPPVQPAVSIHEVNDPPLTRARVRDVRVDNNVTKSIRSFKLREPFPEKRSANLDNWNGKNGEDPSYSWNGSKTAKDISIMKRQEAKITAWENLQKAKAEAEIRQLEMKIEKKRSSSMDKILSKLKSAQKKAQSMRSNVSTKHVHRQVTDTSDKNISFRKARKISFFSGCFTCNAAD
ncbi:uncharacterized protein LOC124910274 [Impatiens glandulifera]|uniref:uncharacterized protein LOC124910274 n=1 Tax=Impatiens glandulifera TaxID=253017 RepID=UPI001FB0C969|nr:uncharacterized protein LOC124910274 [Impatiens glandulifera]